MERYDNDALYELSSRVDLLEYASKTLEFEKRGSSWATNCPLHNDKTPSLFITPNLNQFYCQSCHVGGGIIQWLQTYEDMSFTDAVNKVSQIAGVDTSSLKICESLAIYKKMKKAAMMGITTKSIGREIFDESYLNQFTDALPQLWIDEGISSETMKTFNIRIDENSNRIIYPVYDADFNLIGVKGRTMFQNYKDLNLRKYQNYQRIGTTDFFSGMKENYDEIVKQKSAIIFEGLKSVMKLYGWNWRTAIASETSILNDAQVIILIKMGLKEVTFAYDNDVLLSKIRENTVKLRRYTNVYAVIDRENLLPQNKMSPCDAGLEVWERLYNERIKL